MKTDKTKKYYIFVCHGKDCLKNGATELHKNFQREIKTSAARSYCELIKTRCMDHCKDGPSVMMENAWYGKVTTKDVPKLINKKAVKI